MRLVVRESLSFSLVEIVIGAGVALAAGRWIAPLLFKQSPYDPAVLVLVSFVLLGVAVIAGFLPALRAAGLDPKTARRSE